MGEQRAQFRAMQEGTAEDWGIISSHFRPFAKELPDRIIKHLQLLDGDFGGFPIDRLETRCKPRPARTAMAVMRST